MQQDGRRASFIVTGEPPPDYGSRVVHPGAQHMRAEEDVQPPVHGRRVEEAEAAACSERGAARLKIAQRHGARTYFGWVYQKARAREGVDHSLTDTSPVQATSCL